MSPDETIQVLIQLDRLRVNAGLGLVYAMNSNTPERPIGATTRKGYLRACINFRGRQRHFMVHRIVWVSAHGPIPRGWEVDHKNGKKTDNRLKNLEAVPGCINMHRAVKAGCFTGNGRRDGLRDEKGRFGKKKAGRELDGRTWNELPKET